MHVDELKAELILEKLLDRNHSERKAKVLCVGEVA